MKLYYSPGNANLAPHMILQEIGQAFELVLVDREKNQQTSPEYLKMNPNGRIPVLVDGHIVMYEAAAICLHLADRFPEAKLAPALGTAQRANLYKWLMYLTNTLQAEFLTYFYPDRLCNDAALAGQIKVKAEERVAGMLNIIENELAANSQNEAGKFLLGDQYTVADAYLLMLCRWTRGMKNPAKTRPHLASYLSNLSERPAIRAAFAAEGIEAPFY